MHKQKKEMLAANRHKHEREEKIIIWFNRIAVIFNVYWIQTQRSLSNYSAIPCRSGERVRCVMYSGIFIWFTWPNQMCAICSAAPQNSESLPTNKPFGCDKAGADGQRIFILLVHASQHLLVRIRKPSDALFRAHEITAKMRGSRPFSLRSVAKRRNITWRRKCRINSRKCSCIIYEKSDECLALVRQTKQKNKSYNQLFSILICGVLVRNKRTRALVRA